MFQRFRDWLASYSLISKSAAALWFIFTVLYIEDDAFHDNIFKLFTLYPHLTEFLVGFLVPAVMVFASRKNEEEEPQ